jgi:hypothetical protein
MLGLVGLNEKDFEFTKLGKWFNCLKM